MKNFNPQIVTPNADTYYDALGIPKERAEFLMEMVKIIMRARNDVSEIMIACCEVATTPEEVCFVLFKAGETVGAHFALEDLLGKREH